MELEAAKIGFESSLPVKEKLGLDMWLALRETGGLDMWLALREIGGFDTLLAFPVSREVKLETVLDTGSTAGPAIAADGPDEVLDVDERVGRAVLETVGADGLKGWFETEKKT